MRIEEPDKTATIISADNTTLGHFEFWLNHDWPVITVMLLADPPIHRIGLQKHAEFLRSIVVRWAPAAEKVMNRIAVISWFQTHTNAIKIEIHGSGELLDNLLKWLTERFGVTPSQATQGPASIMNTTDRKLTPTETKVAGYLAKKLTYKEIGERLGNKTEHAARKHAQGLSRKWGTTQYLETLWNEAKKRGY